MPMTSRETHSTLLLALLCASCGASTREPTPPASSPVAVVASSMVAEGSAPVAAWFEDPASVQPGRLHLVLVVDRRVALSEPVSIAFRVPAGVQLVEPSNGVTLARNDAARVDRVELVLELTSVPTTDLIVIIDSQAVAMGVHGEVPYRFGRPEPIVATPPLAAESLVIGGHDLGRPVVVADPSE